MPEQNKKNDDKQVFWYLLAHRRPEKLERLFQQLNQRRRQEFQEELEYLLPYSYLNKVSEKKAVHQQNEAKTESRNQAVAREGRRTRRQRKEKLSAIELNNSLRNYLRFFVFVKSTRTELEKLLMEDWNRGVSHRLSFRYSHERKPLRMTETELRQLMAIVADYHYRFSLRKYDKNMGTDVWVRLKKDFYRDQKGRVLNVVEKNGKTILTIGIPAFNNETLLEISGVRAEDVEIMGGGINKDLVPYLMNEVEQQMTEILQNRILRREDPSARKQIMRTLNSYCDVLNALESTAPDNALHLLTLKLLNTTLRGDYDTKHELVAKAKCMVANPDFPTSGEEAFLLAMLFVATRKGVYRKMLKDYVHETDLITPELRALLPVLKSIQTR